MLTPLHLDDVRLERLAEAHRNAESQDAKAAALEDYATLAELRQTKIDGLGGFDAAVIGEARELASALRERSAKTLAGSPPDDQRTVLDLHNRASPIGLAH